MEQIIKQIIECENKEYDEFMEYQEKRILELKELQKEKSVEKILIFQVF